MVSSGIIFWALLVALLAGSAFGSIEPKNQELRCITSRDLLRYVLENPKTQLHAPEIPDLPPEPWTIEVLANNFTIELGVMNKTLNISSVDHEVYVSADCPYGINGFVDVEVGSFDANIRLNKFRIESVSTLCLVAILLGQLLVAIGLYLLQKRVTRVRQYFHFGPQNKGHLCGCGAMNQQGSFCYLCGQTVHKHEVTR